MSLHRKDSKILPQDEDKLYSLFDMDDDRKKISPSRYQSVIDSTTTLFLNNKLNDASKFKEIIREKDTNGQYEWVFNIDDYDYSCFETNWLLGTSERFLKDLSGKKDVIEKIRKAFQKKHQEKGLSDEEIDLFMRYLV